MTTKHSPSVILFLLLPQCSRCLWQSVAHWRPKPCLQSKPFAILAAAVAPNHGGDPSERRAGAGA